MKRRWTSIELKLYWQPCIQHDTENNEYREPSHCGVCAQNLQTRGLKNGDDIPLVPIFCAGHVGMYQINFFLIKNGNQSDVNNALSEFV